MKAQSEYFNTYYTTCAVFCVQMFDEMRKQALKALVICQ